MDQLTSVGSLPVQDLPLKHGHDQITPDFIAHLKSFSVSDPSIDPVIDKCGSIAVSDIDVAINAFRATGSRPLPIPPVELLWDSFLFCHYFKSFTQKASSPTKPAVNRDNPLNNIEELLGILAQVGDRVPSLLPFIEALIKAADSQDPPSNSTFSDMVSTFLHFFEHSRSQHLVLPCSPEFLDYRPRQGDPLAHRVHCQRTRFHCGDVEFPPRAGIERDLLGQQLCLHRGDTRGNAVSYIGPDFHGDNTY
jgi:hypothetical protein